MSDVYIGRTLASMSVLVAAEVVVGVQGMRYCTVTLLDNLDRCV